MSKPASPYLFDRLQARRANPNTTFRRSESGPRLTNADDDLFLSEASSCENNAMATPPNRGHTPVNPNATLGAREMEKCMDKLSKVNFDLKLELFHCKERMAKLREHCKVLESSAEKANRLVEDNAALLDINDKLVKELEHRDEAVQEAVTIICDLEEKLERAQWSQHRQFTPPEHSSIPHIGVLSPTPEGLVYPSKSNRLPSARPSSASPQRRIPSFMSDKKPSTHALRSVYLEPTSSLHAVKSYASLMTQKEDGEKSVSEVDALDSPRLSVLSESSFPSIYDLPRDGQIDTSHEAGNGPVDGQSGDLSKVTSSKDDILSDVSSWVRVQTPQPLVNSPDSRSLRLSQAEFEDPDQPTRTTHYHSQIKRSSIGGPVFGGALLPPTPDSASTCALQDSYMHGQTDVKIASRPTGKLPNAAKHAALLHSPETPNVTDSNMLHTKAHTRHSISGLGWSNRHSISLSSTDEEEEYQRPDSAGQPRTSSAGSGADYPTGGSILAGTPSRFQFRHKTSPATNVLFDGEGLEQVPRSLHRRRKTLDPEAQLQQSSIMPRRMERSETTPNLANLQTPPPTHQTSKPTFTKSPSVQPRRMERSETTPNLATLRPSSTGASHTNGPQNTTYDPRQPNTPTTRPTPLPHSTSKPQLPPSVRTTLSQKTHKLFHRMSSDHHSAHSPAKRPGTSNSGGSSNEEIMAMQAASSALAAKGLGAEGGKSGTRGGFWRGMGSSSRR